MAHGTWHIITPKSDDLQKYFVFKNIAKGSRVTTFAKAKLEERKLYGKQQRKEQYCKK